MVGGLADWFAVTALFRHPLGLPIPHTAIIPRNKIASAPPSRLSARQFPDPRRRRAADAASRRRRCRRALAGSPAGSQGRLRQGASRLAADMLDAFDQQRLGGMVKSAIGQRLRALEVSPCSARR